MLSFLHGKPTKIRKVERKDQIYPNSITFVLCKKFTNHAIFQISGFVDSLLGFGNGKPCSRVPPRPGEDTHPQKRCGASASQQSEFGGEQNGRTPAD
ncbi:MAG: hypothetical protein K2O37_06905, partial [Bacteroidales bacterium]|nr:hypothetical protein [Bacteroidales bacterium]